ncbi:MAG: hypothetical protein EOO40_10065, partial [Deltaproteobacteria bacterium]
MAESESPRPPSVTAVRPGSPPGAPKITLPAETIKRWKEIVRQALLGGRDISVLVQQYAEQSFNTKLGALDTQGARRRMLARAHAAIERERTRAEAHLEAQPSIKPTILTRSYQANTMQVPGPNDAPPPQPAVRSEKKIDIEWHHTTTQTADPFTKRADVDAHISALTQQMKGIDTELQSIDAVLNKGLRNQQHVVAELATVSRELYRLAQEVQVDLHTKRAPADGSGFQKSARKKQTDTAPQGATGEAHAGPSQPTHTDASGGADSAPGHNGPPAPPASLRTVPINPLVPASKHVARMLGTASAKTSA